MVDRKIILSAATQAVQAQVQFNHLIAEAIGFYDQPRHRALTG
jgi:hypothetical protein